MSYTLPVNYLIVMCLFLFACGGEGQPVVGAPEQTPVVTARLDSLSDTRETIVRTLENPAVATADRKRASWRAQSPFANRSACQGWDGETATITAECCKQVVASYAALLRAPGEYDLAELTTKDPYLNGCKAFNTDFLDAIDQLENPLDDSDAPF